MKHIETRETRDKPSPRCFISNPIISVWTQYNEIKSQQQQWPIECNLCTFVVGCVNRCSSFIREIPIYLSPRRRYPSVAWVSFCTKWIKKNISVFFFLVLCVGWAARKVRVGEREGNGLNRRDERCFYANFTYFLVLTEHKSSKQLVEGVSNRYLWVWWHWPPYEWAIKTYYRRVIYNVTLLPTLKMGQMKLSVLERVGVEGGVGRGWWESVLEVSNSLTRVSASTE